MLADGVYLSDGYINIALLKYKTDEMAGRRGRRTNSSARTTSASRWTTRRPRRSGSRSTAAGSSWTCRRLKDTLYYEEKFRDPEGVIFDISQHGWVTEKPSRES